MSASQIDNDLGTLTPSSTEPKIGGNPPSEPSMGDGSRLWHLLHFSPAELEANRDGRMSARQRLRFGVRALWRIGLAAPIAFVAFALAATVDGLFEVALTVLATMFALYFAWRSVSFASDAVRGQVSVVEGSLEKKTEHEYRSTQFYLIVGELKARIWTGRAFGELPEGMGCRVFYAPSASALLSLETLVGSTPLSPSRPFGPPTARNMARGLEISLLLAAGGLMAIGIGAHIYSEARPATFFVVSGPISGFRAHTFRSSTGYYVSLAGYGEYRLRNAPLEFSPALPDLTRLIGAPASLYMNDRDKNVVAISLDHIYQTDLFGNPEIQARDLKGAGVVALFAGGLFVLPLLLLVAFQLLVLWPRSPRSPAGRSDVTALGRPVVAELIRRVQALTSEQWEQVTGASPISGSPIRPLIDRDQREAIHELANKQVPNTRTETLQTENAIAAVAFGDGIRPRDLVRLFGPFAKTIPCHAVGIEGPVAELCEHGDYQAVVDRFRNTLASHRDLRDLSPAMLPDKPDRIEAALCLAALDATEEEQSNLARNLIELAAFSTDSVGAQVDTLRWLGDAADLELARELEARAGNGNRGVGRDDMLELAHKSRERSLFAWLGCWLAAILFIFGGIVSAYFWFTVGGNWGGWALLGLAAAFTPALGYIVYRVLRRPLGRRFAVLLGVTTTIGAPAAVLGAGWTQINNPGSVAALAIAPPVATVLLAWLLYRRGSAT